MQTIPLQGIDGPIPTFVATPEGPEPWPAVVVVHDALGMRENLHNQARWLADSGFQAAAPDLFHRGGRMRCLFKAMREMAKPRRCAYCRIASHRRHCIK